MVPYKEKPAAVYDVIVIGAGPAGCEAALAAAASGARCLCLSINLDTVGYPPGSPLICNDEDDPRYLLLDELKKAGGALPHLLSGKPSPVPGTGSGSVTTGHVIADRRDLGLAYKHLLESTDGLEVRQALVTLVASVSAGWSVTTRFGESFYCDSLVIAAGTFLKGEIIDAGRSLPGGRRGEIPSNSLVLTLQNLGLSFVGASVSCSPRLDSRILDGNISDAAGSNHFASLPADGSQLKELYGLGIDTGGNIMDQLASCRKNTGASETWVTRPAYVVNHLLLAANQINPSLESLRLGGLFFAGRAAGGSGYVESSVLGNVAGNNAALLARGKKPQIPGSGLTAILCEASARNERRPVGIDALKDVM